MIKRVQRESGDSGLRWVFAVILDESEIDESALLEMEQREQLTENFKVRYNDIDYLLALKEAAEIRDVDWFDRESIQEVAGKLQTTVEKSRPEVVRDLYAIKYMDLFLEDSGQPAQYHRLLRTLETFRDIGRMMITVESDYPDDFDRGLQVLFAAVRAGKTYGDIRQLREIFRRDRARFDELAESISAEEATIQPNSLPILASPVETAPEDSDDGEEEDEVSSPPSVTNYPTAVGRMIDVSIDGYRSARQADTVRVLGEIVNRIDSLSVGDRLSHALTDPTEGTAARDALGRIVAWVDTQRSLLD